MEKNADILERLKRVEGQIRGIHKMIEGERSCSDVMTQLAAATSALDKVGFMIVSRSIRECILDNIESGKDRSDAVEQAVKLLMSLSRHST